MYFRIDLGGRCLIMAGRNDWRVFDGSDSQEFVTEDIVVHPTHEHDQREFNSLRVFDSTVDSNLF